MKYRAKIYIDIPDSKGRKLSRSVTSRETFYFDVADWTRMNLMSNIEQATGGHIERYVDGIGWVVCDEEENG